MILEMSVIRFCLTTVHVMRTRRTGGWVAKEEKDGRVRAAPLTRGLGGGGAEDAWGGRNSFVCVAVATGGLRTDWPAPQSGPLRHACIALHRHTAQMRSELRRRPHNLTIRLGDRRKCRWHPSSGGSRGW